MEDKKPRLWKLFGPKKSDCCNIEIEQIPENEAATEAFEDEVQKNVKKTEE